ncbi:MAG: hypothetical protein ACYCOU_00100 [Sulfobacillus sp.]
MAAGTSVLALGERDTFGGHFYGPSDHSGPPSYPTGGELVDPVALGCPNGVQSLIPSADTTATYWTIAVPLGTGKNVQWKLIWILLSSGVQPNPGTNLSGYKIRLSAIGT